MDKLGGVFLFGVAFAVMIAGMGTGVWLLVKLVSALGWLRLSPEERERQAAAARHPFAKVSLRGKAAWLICCLEQALLAWGLDAEEGEPGSWYPVLALLWKFPELPEECLEDWLGQAEDILPSNLPDLAPRPQGGQVRLAAALYREAGSKMALLGPLVELPVRLVRENREEPGLHPELPLALLDEAKELLESYGVPQPPADIRDFLLGQRSPGMGERFVGRQCSQGFVGW